MNCEVSHRFFIAQLCNLFTMKMASHTAHQSAWTAYAYTSFLLPLRLGDLPGSHHAAWLKSGLLDCLYRITGLR